jgi:hypothetical protein
MKLILRPATLPWSLTILKKAVSSLASTLAAEARPQKSPQLSRVLVVHRSPSDLETNAAIVEHGKRTIPLPRLWKKQNETPHIAERRTPAREARSRLATDN